jgi:hypothetical protein
LKPESLEAVVRALEIGVFEQVADGAFTSVGALPDWMQAFSQNPTFPFLGSFLMEARAFWAEPRDSRLTWGPCVEVDAAGREFHFRVSALSLPDHKFLVFELDHHAEETRAILQKAREVVLERQTGPAANLDSTDGGQ